MGQSISERARELYAEHCSVMASMTPEQRLGRFREDMAERQGNFNHKTMRENLIAMFEREAAGP